MLNKIFNTSIYFLYNIFNTTYNIYIYYKKLQIKDVNNINVNIKSKTCLLNDYNIIECEYKRNLDVYLFNYIIPKNEDINKYIENTKINLIKKDKNKDKILYASLINKNEDSLCDILKLIRQYRYYFDENNHIVTWDIILHIIKTKYPKEIINTNETYIHIVLNDSNMTEQIKLLESIKNDSVIF